jgi:F0F1-type ATP synthase delta subunit
MVKVYTKIALDKDLQMKVLETVNARLHKKYELSDLEFLIDDTILSGIRIDEDSEVIDLTLNNKINQILDVLS